MSFSLQIPTFSGFCFWFVIAEVRFILIIYTANNQFYEAHWTLPIVTKDIGFQAVDALSHRDDADVRCLQII